MKTVLTAGFSGLSVTVPYKTAIIPFLDELSEGYIILREQTGKSSYTKKRNINLIKNKLL